MCRLAPSNLFTISAFLDLARSSLINPVAGLRNMRKSLKPGGIMTMIVWRGIKDNPWLGSAKDVVLRYLPVARRECADMRSGTVLDG